MSLSETRTFLEDLVLRYSSDTDISEGSRAQSELIEPILQRIGIDPFDEDISVFVRDRVRQAFPTLAITEADDLTDVLIDPMRVLIEPLVREVKLVKLRASLQNQASLSDDEVDALMGNFFESRRAGGYATGVVRIYFATPQTISIGITQPGTTRSGLRFVATRPQQITSDEMRLNIAGTEYYFDVNFTSENRGDEYNVEAGEIVSIAALPTATRVANLRRLRGGTVRETSADFIGRAERSQGDKTLTVERGITSTLFENFPALRRLFVIGFRDPEMMRDVVEGGSLGPVPADDLSGSFYGLATAVDDLNGDATTTIFEATTGSFVSRLGSVGSTPTNWYVTLVYTSGTDLVVVDAQVQRVVSSTQLETNHEIPLAGVTNFTWMLRERKLTISNIPGGVVLPDTATAELELRTNQIHIGGKTDVYVAGETEQGTAAIGVLTDEFPIARGFDANTSSDAFVTLNDGVVSGIEAGMSLVIEEGQDVGSYLILQVTPPASSRVSPATAVNQTVLLVSATLTGTQSNLSYRVVNEIDVNLTDPKSLKVDGSDLMTVAGSKTVQTVSATNFLDVNIQTGDILNVISALGGGEFTVTEVGATYLKVTPALTRTLSTAPYQVFTRYTGVATPVVRVTGLELLDSANAPTGTLIPYREPVLALSHSFQNEGSGYQFDNLVSTGLVSWVGIYTGIGNFWVGLSGGSLSVGIYDADSPWKPTIAIVSITFSPGANPIGLTSTEVVNQINAYTPFTSQGIRAVLIQYSGKDYIGLVAGRLISVTVNQPILGMYKYMSNAIISSLDAQDTLTGSKVRRSDVVEILTGNNSGTVARILSDPATSTSDRVTVGTGPLGPEGTTALYYVKILKPDVGARARVSRSSVGSARVFFQTPTSVEFDFRTTQFTTIVDDTTLNYIPDPENMRTVLPAYPRTDLETSGTSATGATSTLTDASQDFLLQRIQEGDILEILYRPIVGTAPLAAPPALIAVSGLTLILRIGLDPFITVNFPNNVVRQEVADYINTRVGEDVAFIATGGELTLKASRKIEVDDTSTARVVLFIALPVFPATTIDTNHPDRGEYIIQTVASHVLTLSLETALTTTSVPDTYYKIKRYVQRISSTEMNLNVDASGLYYVDVELVSAAPGDLYNIGNDVEFGVTGYRSDGYRLTTDNEITSFSRAEVLRAQISPSILLVGSSDSPEEYVQLPNQSVQVAYERSQLVDDIQSFCDSDYQRVICEEILVRHLTPHYVSFTWSYVGGSSEPTMLRAVSDLLDAIEPGEEFEVGDVIDLLRKRGAVSVYTPDARAASGRSAPLFVIVYHDTLRRVRGIVVKDFVDTVRTQRFLPGNITLNRVSTGGIR